MSPVRGKRWRIERLFDSASAPYVQIASGCTSRRSVRCTCTRRLAFGHLGTQMRMQCIFVYLQWFFSLRPFPFSAFDVISMFITKMSIRSGQKISKERTCRIKLNTVISRLTSNLCNENRKLNLSYRMPINFVCFHVTMFKQNESKIKVMECFA